MATWNKKLSFMLIPGSRNSLRQFSISYGFIIFAAVLVVFLFVANIYLTTSYMESRASEAELRQLRVENNLLVDKYNEMRTEVDEISAVYENIVEKEVVIRNIFNLPEISNDERQLGIGGPTGGGENYAKLSEAVKVARTTELEVDALLRLAGFEKEKYEEVYDALVEKKSILDHTPSIMPTRGYRTRGFGQKLDPFTGYKRFHAGIDISNKTGTPIYSTADGIVHSAGRSGGLGKVITINHGYGYKTRYAHLSNIKVTRGQKVRRGDLIGLMGSTGYSTGPHLHYEVIKNGKPVNPLEFILNQ
jgi:murein DD-endopeptidase MepM/ murein hydrolase activator NlpD